VGRIEVAEPRVVEVTPKVDGFVEVLFANATGESVRQGEPLLTIYSPALVAAQEELLTARRLVDRIEPKTGEAWRNAETMLQAARRRLEYWDIPAEQVQQIEETGEIAKALPLVAPASGVVLEKDVIEGQRVMSGDRLYRIADLSVVWVEGDVFEQDLQLVRVGSQAHIEVSAYPGHHLMGRVSFVYPTMDKGSRTNRVRVTVRNTDMRLKPGMFATVFFDANIGDDVLAVPLEAVILTGERNIVFVHHDDGSYMPHEVVLGARTHDHVQILSGVLEGQTIVASANFLVDAESQLGGTGGSMAGMDHGDGSTGGESPAAEVEHEDHD
jgi:RND family efflux transporter MFP subunit